ncbi:MAG: hypothetical protein QXK06_04995 [Candidatus Diapherotrites archaeon]
MKKSIVFFAILLLLPLPCTAKEPVKTFMVSVESNDGVLSIESVKVVADYLSETESTGQHAIKLKNAENKTLYQLLVYMGVVAFPPYGAETQMTEEDFNKFYENAEKNFTKTIWLPYMENARFVVLEGLNGEIARFDLSVLCNHDGKCNPNENFLSCEQDCPLEKKDNYCLPLKDKICDPDCITGIDLDCIEQTPTPSPSIEKQSDFLPIIALVFIAIVVLVFLRKKLKRKI